MELYRDYGWKEGKPYGKHPLSNSSEGFRIIADPYKKRFSVEMYEKGGFAGIAYDSGLFDFRLLFRGEDASWQREVLLEDEGKVETLIRNMDERIVLREEMLFMKGVCIQCNFHAPQGIYLGTQKILWKCLGNSMDGVILQDARGRNVWEKEYAIDPTTGAFGALIKEITSF